MDKKEMEEKIIEQYRQDENMMILVFAQWCVNNGLKPEELYHEAYPEQGSNKELEKTLELTVPKEESEPIPDTTVLNVLQLYGNDDLAFIVNREIEKRKKQEND
ncbi:hypothetical protein ERJ70_01315 [Sediminibacillus dalangtanensis]|uniref:Uncharacterized protein n=1 Tax=Sediminibacillus dalangtanensis TaxID=2729421 RepID=A0ABX7VMN2_9BACI|nr:hypothetical protein [Sediminibacillus dalangtanensis]QTM98077.1 hypothetical protein ERJ70_01315 [Sediminibacillus dalangtanensis]